MGQGREKQNVDTTRKNLPPGTNIVGNKEPMGKRNATDIIGTIRTTEGRYDAAISDGDTNNFHLQKQLKLTRYSIREPPRAVRNIPMFHTSGQLQTGKVLKFDIRNPYPGRQMWNRRQGGKGPLRSGMHYRNNGSDT